MTGSRMRIGWGGLLAGVLITGSAAAATWHILPDGSGDAPTIQAGIEAAAHYDTVLVAPGVYSEVLNFLGKKIVVGSHFMGTQDSTIIAQTIIDGEDYWESIVTFAHGEERASILCGLTLINGEGSWQGFHYGGGIICVNGSPTLRDLIIRDCLYPGSDEFGGGIAVIVGMPLIEGVLIENCGASEGGGIQCEGSGAHPVIRNSRISGNVANWGAGIGLFGGATAWLENVVINGNRGSSGPGMGISCQGSSRVVLVNTTLSDNMGGGLLLAQDGRGILANCIFWSDEEAEIEFWAEYGANSLVLTHCDIRNGLDGIQSHGNGTVAWLDGNIDGDPLFLDAEAGDFRLSPDSPCINAGTDHFEWDGELIVDLEPEDYCGLAPDMGALESCPEPSGIPDAGPLAAQLLGAHPNPFNPRTSIRFLIRKSAQVQIGIYDAGGRRLAPLANRRYDPGEYSLSWDGHDSDGRELPSGTYLVRMSADEGVETRKITLLR